jgi:hypothetical protein
MQPGRNLRIRKRLPATATFILLVGAAFLAAAPATASLNLGGAAAGGLDSVWGLGGGASGGGGEAQGQGDGSMSGSVSSAAQGAADVAVTPPDPQPHVDEAQRVLAEAQAEAEAQANALLAQKESIAAGGVAQWGLRGDGAGAYDVVLGGGYASGLQGLATASGQKTVDHRVDVRGHQGAAAGAANEAEGAINGVIGTIEQLYGKLHASFDVGLDGAMTALGSIGFDIAGLFGMQQGAELANVDSLGLRKHVDVAAPAMAFERVDLPEVEVPALAVDQSGEVGMDAAAAAKGLIKA